jgi:glycosyltransferase involved in cell wall biosynthesis
MAALSLAVVSRVYTELLYGRMRDLYGRASVVAVTVRATITASGLRVVLEGMASGRPVVATETPLAEYVIDGVTRTPDIAQ